MTPHNTTVPYFAIFYDDSGYVVHRRTAKPAKLRAVRTLSFCLSTDAERENIDRQQGKKRNEK